MKNEAQKVGAEDSADITTCGRGWQGKDGGFGSKIKPLGKGAEEKFEKGDADWRE